MWLLRTLPNNVLCHVGINHDSRAPNACITNHSVRRHAGGDRGDGGAAPRRGRSRGRHRPRHADRAADACSTTTSAACSPRDTMRPFDARRERQPVRRGRRRAGAGDRAASAAARNATVIGEVLGGGNAGEATRPARDPRRRRRPRARDRATHCTTRSWRPADIGMVVAHGNGTPLSDASEAAALRRVFGDAHAAGHRIQVVDRPPDRRGRHHRAVIALAALRAERRARASRRSATLDPDCAGLQGVERAAGRRAATSRWCSAAALPAPTPRSSCARHDVSAAGGSDPSSAPADPRPTWRRRAAASTASRSRASSGCSPRRRAGELAQDLFRAGARGRGDGAGPGGKPRRALRGEGSLRQALPARAGAGEGRAGGLLGRRATATARRRSSSARRRARCSTAIGCRASRYR